MSSDEVELALRLPSASRYGTRTVTVAGRTITIEVRDFTDLPVHDLRPLPAVRVVAQSTAEYAVDPGSLQTDIYRLVLEPAADPGDAAIAVFSGERKAGYLAAAKSTQYRPLLQALGDAVFLVGGASDEQTMPVLLPAVPALRRYVALHAQGGSRPRAMKTAGPV